MSTYVFDHALEPEHERLVKLEEWLDPGTLRYLDMIGVQTGWRCLEVAAGAGSIARRLAERVGPEGSVLATDLDLKFLDDIDVPNIEVRKHDILSDELPENSFDIAHVRLLLMHLPARDQALRNIIAAIKPGGWVFIEDMEFISWTEITPSQAMANVRAAMIRLFELAQANPFYGRQLPFVMTQAGLEDVWAEGRIAWGQRENNPGIENLRLTLIELREPFIASGLVSSEDLDELIRQLDDPSWWFVPPTIVAAYGRKPAHRDG